MQSRTEHGSTRFSDKSDQGQPQEAKEAMPGKGGEEKPEEEKKEEEEEVDTELSRLKALNAAIARGTGHRESLSERDLAELLNIHGDVPLHDAHIVAPHKVPHHVLSSIVTLPVKCT
jgi:hypothetical protein